MVTSERSFFVRSRLSFERWSVPLLALLTASMGIVNLLSATMPALPERIAILRQISPMEVRHGSHLTSVLAGFALLVLSINLWRRKQVAWGMTVIILIISIITHIFKGLDYEEALLAGSLLILLWLARNHFYALSDRPSIWQGILVVAGALVFTLVYGTAGFYLHDRQFSMHFELIPALMQTVTMFSSFYDPGLVPLTGFGRYFANSIYAVGLITLSYGLFMLVRPVLLRRAASAEENRHAQRIIEIYGRSALARLCLLNDKSYFFSQGGSVIAFVEKGRMAIALGDPIGPTDDANASIKSFQSFCARNDWRPAFYQTLPDHLEIYHQCSFETLQIGQEAIVNVALFSLEGSENKSIRTGINRLTKLGYRTEVMEPPISETLMDELRLISDEWLTMMHGTEKRFSVGWFDNEYIRNGRVVVIFTPEGHISAFANILPEYQKNEISIDLMRHRKDIVNGTMDFLFVAIFQWAKTQGYSTFSLGLSALAGVGGHPDAPVPEKLLHYVYEHISRFYNFKGLHGFKEKYHPAWEPRYLIHPGTASLPDVITALARADSGDSLLQNYLRNLMKKN
jgi:phosphatidylglycerol lysyltransferase